MAIRFTDKTTEHPSRKPAGSPAAKDAAVSDGAARFATPIEAVKPVNPDPAGTLPFTDLPAAETGARKKRGAKTPHP